MKDGDAFIRDLRAWVARQDQPVLGMSFYNGLVAGTLTREQLKRWSIGIFYVAGQHIRASVGGVFLNTGLSPLNQKIRRYLAAKMIDEETDEGRGDEPHWKLAMRLARAFGATDEEIMHPLVAKEAVEYVNWVIELGRMKDGPVTMAAMSIGGESRSETGAAEMVKALHSHYGMTTHDLGFFYAHMGEAEDHAEPVFEIVRAYATTAERQRDVREQIEAWTEKFRAAQEGGYRVAVGTDPGVRVTLE